MNKQPTLEEFKDNLLAILDIINNDQGGIEMKEKKYILNVGLNDKDTKLQKIDSIEAYKIVENTLLNNGLDGYTIYQGKGLYKHDNGTITQENTLIIEMIFTTDDIVNKIIKILKQVLNQESIMKQVQEINISFE